jgi:uncharacterized coiled-coil DUF342 family protein
MSYTDPSKPWEPTPKVSLAELFKVSFDEALNQALQARREVERLIADKKVLQNELMDNDKENAHLTYNNATLSNALIKANNTRDSLTGQVNALKEENRRLKEERDALLKDVQELTQPEPAKA